MIIDIDNNFLILSKGPTQELDETSLTVEAQYLINISKSNRKFCLSLHHNGSNIFYFLMLQKINQFKVNDTGKKYPLLKK